MYKLTRTLPSLTRTIHPRLIHSPTTMSAKQSKNDVPKPPPEDHHELPKSEIPYTGWDAPVPSKAGGTGEQDYMHKPPYEWRSDQFVPKYRSKCWCGYVEFEFHGDPLDAKHCHCRQCQRLHGAPFQWAVLFPKTSCRMVQNKENALHFFSTETIDDTHHVPCKVSCNRCRAPLFDEGRNMIMAYPSSFLFEDGKIPLKFQPSAHIFYESRVMNVRDGVPKWSGHKGESELMPETHEDPEKKEGTLPKY